VANYYYAYSGHKYGLDRVRRGVAMIKMLRENGVEMQLLVNDFRAGLAAQDLGVAGAVTIETILDVDAVAQRGDGVVLDTPEDRASRLEQYADRFAPLFVWTESRDAHSEFGEILLKPFCEEVTACIETPVVDPDYFRESAKEGRQREERILFIFGDADYDKEISAHRDFFEGMEMDLLLGYYFFVKYEGELEKLFHQLYEPEEYSELLKKRSRVLTASAQSALEAAAAGANVAYMKNTDESDMLLTQLARYNIKIIDRFDKKGLQAWISMPEKGEKSSAISDKVGKQLFAMLNL